jgi:hypothetical protein
MTVTVEIPPELAEDIEAIARVHGKPVAQFLLDSARLHLRPDVLSREETRLFDIINASLAPEARAERAQLLLEEEQRDLTPAEYDRLIELTDEVEIAGAKRWQAIGELATLRGLSLDEMARQLEIPLSS